MKFFYTILSSRPTVLQSCNPAFIFFLFFLVITLSLNAQDRCPYNGNQLPSRNVSSYVENFTITDTEGNTYELYETLDSGMTVFIDLFFTRCGYCQQYAPIIEQIYQNTGAGQEDILMWGISNDPYDTDPVIDQYKLDFDITNPCAGPQGGGIQAFTTIIAAQNFLGFPTYCVICPDRNMFFDPVYPPTVTGFDPYFEQCAAVVGVEEELQNKRTWIITMYPNPVIDRLNLELNLQKSGLINLELFSLTGVSVMKREDLQQAGSISLSLDLSALPPGYYILKLSQDNQLIGVKRVIVL